METLPERVVWLRDAAALPKRGLSKLAGLDPSHVRLLENSNGLRTSRRTAEALAAVFDVELPWLMLGVGPCVAAHPDLDPANPEHRAALVKHITAAVERARAARPAVGHTANDFTVPTGPVAELYPELATGTEG